MSKIIIDLKLQFEIDSDDCPKAVFDELKNLNAETIISDDIGRNSKISDKTADWLADNLNREDGEFLEYEIYSD